MGRFSTVDVLVSTSLDQLLFRKKLLSALFTKQASLMRRPTVLSLPLQLVFLKPFNHHPRLLRQVVTVAREP
jgi:hypothetical protein